MLSAYTVPSGVAWHTRSVKTWHRIGPGPDANVESSGSVFQRKTTWMVVGGIAVLGVATVLLLRK